MKVLFCNPPWWVDYSEGVFTPKLLCGVRAGSRWPSATSVLSTPGHYQFGDYLPYPFFLGSAASYLAAQAGIEVSFRDSLALREDYFQFFDYLVREDFDYIILESATPCFEHDAKLIAQIKLRVPRSRIVLAGPIASLGWSLLDELPLHAVIQGEYEKGCLKVVQGANGLLPHDLLSEAELNAAPYPYFDARHAHLYWDPNPKGQMAPQLQVLSSRGCPFKCIFCVWPAVMSNNDPDGQAVRKVRQLTPDYLEGMLRELVGKFNYRCVYFDDDTFNLGDRHVEGVCEVMRRIGLPWSAMCRADTVSRPTWKLMRECGCFGVKLGFESGNQWVNDNIVHKNLNLAEARETAVYLHELGFSLHGTFTLGLPGETQEQMADTVRYRQSLPLDSFQESHTAEIDGAPLATLRRRGKLEKYGGAKFAQASLAEDRAQRRAEALRQAGKNLEENPELSEALCLNLLAINEKDAQALRMLGDLAAQARQFHLAARYYARAVQNEPDNEEICLKLADLLHERGLIEEAASCYRHVLEFDAENISAKKGLLSLEASLHSGVVLDRLGLQDVDEALRKMNKPGFGRWLKMALWLSDLARQSVAKAVLQAEAGLCGESLGEETLMQSGNIINLPQTSEEDLSSLRLHVLDHGLRYEPGHHLAYDLGLREECLRRKVDVRFYAAAECTPEAVKRLGAKPVLKPMLYTVHSNDIYCGYLEDFNIASELAEYNLSQVLNGHVEPEDIVYVHTAAPKIVMGIAAWYIDLPKWRRPFLCLKFQNQCYRFVNLESRALVESVFRLSLKPFKNLEKVFLAASNQLIAKQIKAVSGKPCQVFPIPLQLSKTAKSYLSRAEKKRIRIGYAGEGRDEQGVDLLPEVIAAVIEKHPEVSFTIQLGCSFTKQATLEKLRGFAQNVDVVQRSFLGHEFHELIRGFDALLLPYLPSQYIERSSQIVIEAIALGVPLIVPQKTSLSFEAKEFDCGHTLISSYSAPAVSEAIEEFLARHDDIALKSVLAAEECARFHSGRTLLDMLLELRRA